jgi:4-hydroxy-tetrahydrodipicolinate reductase
MQLVLVGAGPVGRAAALAAVEDGIAEEVIAVVDPDEAARTAACSQFDAAGLPSVADLRPGEEGDAAVVAFSSRAEATGAEIVRLVSLGYHVVTTCEELADPGSHVRRGIAASAHSDGRVVIATGANPGFVMDRLAVVAAQAARSVRSIVVERVIDTSDRREPLVVKTGRGATPEEFAAGAAAGTLGHVGMAESARLLAHGMGWIVSDVVESIDPVVSDGVVEGLHQVARLKTLAGHSIVLDLVMTWGAADPHDEVIVDGEPPIRLRIDGGYHGDSGTTASVTRALALIPYLEPGFYRPTDLPLRPSK